MDVYSINTLLDKYKDLAFAIANKFVKNEANAQDIVQEAFVKVFLNFDKFNEESAFSTWLYKIIYHESITFIRKEKRFISVYDEIKNNPYSENLSYDNSKNDLLEQGLRSLSSNEYLVINLFYIEEKSIKEIELITSWSSANIRIILYRARNKMYNFFKQKGISKIDFYE